MLNLGKKNPPKNVLVIGDWLVDDHWVTGIHRSATASRTGSSHYRALHSPDSISQSFCGAGRTASILHRSRAEKLGSTRAFNIKGIGIWNPEDTELLARMLEPETFPGSTPYRLIQPRPCEIKGKQPNLLNLADVLLPTDTFSPEECTTTRIIRIYQNTGGKIELIQRIDWETPMPKIFPSWINKDFPFQENKLESFLTQEGNVDAIVVKDLCKGVASSRLLQFIIEHTNEETPWFISSKGWRPDWLNELRNAHIKLLLIPQVAAQTAVREGALNTWITKRGLPSKSALEEIDDISTMFELSNDMITIVLPEGLGILARDKKRQAVDQRLGLVQPERRSNPRHIPVPMASVFFGAAIATLLYKKDIELEDLTERSVDFTKKWMDHEIQRFQKNSWHPSGEPALKIAQHNADRTTIWSNQLAWNKEKRTWKQAFSLYGVITSSDGKRLELGRSMTEVDHYVCCVKAKRKVLRKIKNSMSNFIEAGATKNKSCLLLAPPGSGKTHLVKCLAKSMNLRRLKFNITQMLSRRDILDCFDTIVTTQSQNHYEPLVVFFDEINAKLDNQTVYDSFLAPLDEGIYIRAGKAFHIEPCFWIFAGTNHPSSSEENDQDTTKAPDFESRLSARPLKLEIDTHNKKEADEARLEKVYLGASLLQSEYPDVRSVSEKVLRTFHGLRPSLEVRELAHFVRSFVDIQYGKVLSKNVSMEWLENYRNPRNSEPLSLDIGDWNGWPEGDMVEIIGAEMSAG